MLSLLQATTSNLLRSILWLQLALRHGPQTAGCQFLHDWSRRRQHPLLRLVRIARHIARKSSRAHRARMVSCVVRRLDMVTWKSPMVKLFYFLEAVRKHGVPDQVTIDKGSENTLITFVLDELRTRGVTQVPPTSATSATNSARAFWAARRLDSHRFARLPVSDTSAALACRQPSNLRRERRSTSQIRGTTCRLRGECVGHLG